MGSIRVEQDGDVLVLRRRAGTFVACGVLLLVLSPWTVGCVRLVAQGIRQPTFAYLLFGIPFWASWAFVACLLAWMLFGREWMRVGPDGLDHGLQAIITLPQRHVPLREITGIGFFSKVVDSKSGRTEDGLWIVTLGRPIQFGQGVDEAERIRLADLLRGHFHRLLPDRTIPILKDEPQPEDVFLPPPGVEILSPSKARTEPPSDTRIQVGRDRDGTVFVRRGPLSLAALEFLTCLNLFWNGIVGVFVLQAVRDGSWSMLPFGIMGIGFFLAWWATLLAPLAVRTWTVSPGEIGVRFSVLGIGRTRQYEPGRFVRVELRRGGRKPRFKFEVEGRDLEGDSPYWLALIGRDGKDALTIDHLSEGDARWIGSEVARVLPKGQGPLATGPEPLYDRWLDVR